MSIFAKKKDTIADNAIAYTEKLIQAALKEYELQKKKVSLFEAELNNNTLSYYERQYMGMVQKRVIDVINTTKGIFGPNNTEIMLLCKELEDDVVLVSTELYTKNIDKKLKKLSRLIKKDVSSE